MGEGTISKINYYMVDYKISTMERDKAGRGLNVSGDRSCNCNWVVRAGLAQVTVEKRQRRREQAMPVSGGTSAKPEAGTCLAFPGTEKRPV